VPEQSKQSKEQGSKTLEELIAAHLPSEKSTHKLEVGLEQIDLLVPVQLS
jgi:hypothetical protein